MHLLSDSMAAEELTEYERKRLENIRRNGEMLAALNIRLKTSQLSDATKRQRVETSSKTYKSSPKKKPKIETPVVIRRSLRIRGMSPASKGSGIDSDEPPVKEKESFGQQKPSPGVLGPLKMGDVLDGPVSDRPLIELILSIEKSPDSNDSVKREFGEYDPAIEPRTQGVLNDSVNGQSLDAEVDVEKKIFNGVKSIRAEPGDELLNNSVECWDRVKIEKKEYKSCVDPELMSLEPENIARVMPGRIMVVKFLPREDVMIVAAGNKFGNVSFWNVQNREENDGIYVYCPHTGPISGILFQQYCMSKIYTSCYDGFVRLMDAEKEVFDLIYSSEYTIFSLSQRPNDMKSLYFGEGRGALSVWDERKGGFSSQWVLHEDRINSIDFSSQNPNIMSTSSSDGTACLWDLRNIKSDKPKSLKILSHKRAVHSAYFSPSGSYLATTSADDTVGILSGVDFGDSSMIYHNNQTGRWISSFRAIWGWDDSAVFIGNMKRGVDVISPAQRRAIMTLQSPHISAIPCRFDAHPFKVGTLAGATSGGQVYIWTPSSE